LIDNYVFMNIWCFEFIVFIFTIMIFCILNNLTMTVSLHCQTD